MDRNWWLLIKFKFKKALLLSGKSSRVFLIQKMKSLTLMELLIVIIIVGIFSTLAITQYGGYRERALDREAIANLRLIQAAERIFRMEQGTYYPAALPDATTNNINTNLHLSLPTGNNRNWNYTCQAATGTVTAQRYRFVGSPTLGRSWTLLIANENPTCSSSSATDICR
jgi:type II secretory pathway pseudopilin PulG